MNYSYRYTVDIMKPFELQKETENVIVLYTKTKLRSKNYRSGLITNGFVQTATLLNSVGLIPLYQKINFFSPECQNIA